MLRAQYRPCEECITLAHLPLISVYEIGSTMFGLGMMMDDSMSSTLCSTAHSVIDTRLLLPLLAICVCLPRCYHHHTNVKKREKEKFPKNHQTSSWYSDPSKLSITCWATLPSKRNGTLNIYIFTLEAFFLRETIETKQEALRHWNCWFIARRFHVVETRTILRPPSLVMANPFALPRLETRWIVGRQILLELCK